MKIFVDNELLIAELSEGELREYQAIKASKSSLVDKLMAAMTLFTCAAILIGTFAGYEITQEGRSYVVVIFLLATLFAAVIQWRSNVGVDTRLKRFYAAHAVGATASTRFLSEGSLVIK